MEKKQNLLDALRDMQTFEGYHDDIHITLRIGNQRDREQDVAYVGTIPYLLANADLEGLKKFNFSYMKSIRYWGNVSSFAVWIEYNPDCDQNEDE